MWNRLVVQPTRARPVFRSMPRQRRSARLAVLSLSAAVWACAPRPQSPRPAAPGPTPPAAAAPIPSRVAGTAASTAPGTVAQPPAHVTNERFEIHAPADVIDAMQSDLAFASTEFARYFPAVRPTIGVVAFKNATDMQAFDWTPIKARRQQTLPWLVGLSQSPTVSASSVEGVRALSHEVCHKYLIGYMTSAHPREAGARPAAGMPSYGAPSLPDWLDEATAVLCESEQSKAQRLAGMRSQHSREQLIPLAELLTMEHPVAKALGAFIAAQRKAAMDSAGTRSSNEMMMRVTPPPGMLDGARSGQFYAQSYSLAAFLAEREGPTFLSHLAGALGRGQTMEDVLKEPGRKLPKDVASLERAWKTWAGLD